MSYERGAILFSVGCKIVISVGGEGVMHRG